MSDYLAKATTVVLLAAGRGARMRPLTDTTPKPLLTVGPRTLIEHHLSKLASLGFKNVVINTAHLAEQFPAKLGDGAQYGLSIQYSDESQFGALETAGGLQHAVPLIHSDPFLVINSDIWTDFDFTVLLRPLGVLGRLVMVNNPAHNQRGDFVLKQDGYLDVMPEHTTTGLTFSGIALYHKAMFAPLPHGKQALAPLLRNCMKTQQLEGIQHTGKWVDVGTPERLEQLNQTYKIRY
ncbi:N-acetylmuramate alpha-1-phosphate uridylyltransferase MurU [Arenicella xantha]|uniref:MurNAc alpha-1-phosphate uridylyltransferase n=1 Tax=Arenicella xantha TaxID=644221 RepID=A0A395JKF7_9GAMM|nr:nucleotidyltransferase family protein [Arenicella xantha]RBP50915.1 MurNAc alpha-1-phosphate uridylyltransferase [Arenicella xantha]